MYCLALEVSEWILQGISCLRGGRNLRCDAGQPCLPGLPSSSQSQHLPVSPHTGMSTFTMPSPGWATLQELPGPLAGLIMKRTEPQFKGTERSLAMCPRGHLLCAFCRVMYVDHYWLSPPSLFHPTSSSSSCSWWRRGLGEFEDPYQGKLSWETD